MSGERNIDVTRSNYSVVDSEFDSMRERFENEMRRVEDEMQRLRHEFDGYKPVGGSSLGNNSSLSEQSKFGSNSQQHSNYNNSYSTTKNDRFYSKCFFCYNI